MHEYSYFFLINDKIILKAHIIIIGTIFQNTYKINLLYLPGSEVLYPLKNFSTLTFVFGLMADVNL